MLSLIKDSVEEVLYKECASTLKEKNVFENSENFLKYKIYSSLARPGGETFSVFFPSLSLWALKQNMWKSFIYGTIFWMIFATAIVNIWPHQTFSSFSAGKQKWKGGLSLARIKH